MNLCPGLSWTGYKVRIFTKGGTEPVWSGNGRELFYRSGRKVLVVPLIKTSPELIAGKPVQLFDGLIPQTRIAAAMMSCRMANGSSWYGSRRISAPADQCDSQLVRRASPPRLA